MAQPIFHAIHLEADFRGIARWIIDTDVLKKTPIACAAGIRHHDPIKGSFFRSSPSQSHPYRHVFWSLSRCACLRSRKRHMGRPLREYCNLRREEKGSSLWLRKPFRLLCGGCALRVGKPTRHFYDLSSPSRCSGRRWLGAARRPAPVLRCPPTQKARSAEVPRERCAEPRRAARAAARSAPGAR